MKTISADVCASFEIEWICEIDWDKNTAGMKYLLPSFTLPTRVPTFQAAFDIVSREKSEENADEYDYNIRGSIVTVNKVDSAVEKVYLEYGKSMNLLKFICNKYLNRTKTFSQSEMVVYSDSANNMNNFLLTILTYHFDISATHSDYVYELCDQLMASKMWPGNKAP